MYNTCKSVNYKFRVHSTRALILQCDHSSADEQNKTDMNTRTIT